MTVVTPEEPLAEAPEAPPLAEPPPVMAVIEPSDWLQPVLPPSDTAASSSKAPMIGLCAPTLRRRRSFVPMSPISPPSIIPI